MSNLAVNVLNNLPNPNPSNNNPPNPKRNPSMNVANNPSNKSNNLPDGDTNANASVRDCRDHFLLTVESKDNV